jgi:hypothetical protein
MKRGHDRGDDCQISTRRVELVHNLGDVENREREHRHDHD